MRLGRWIPIGFLFDLLWAAVAPLMSVLFRERMMLTDREFDGTIIYVLTSVVVAAVVMSSMSIPSRMWRYTTHKDTIRIAVCVMLCVIITTFIVFILNRHDGVSRTVPLLHFVFLLLPMFATRAIWRWAFWRADRNVGQEGRSAYAHDSGGTQQKILVCGVNRVGILYTRVVEELLRERVEVVGLLDDDPKLKGRHVSGIEILGSARKIKQILDDTAARGIVVDKIMITSKWNDLSRESQHALDALRASTNISIEVLDDWLGMRNETAGDQLALPGFEVAENQSAPILQPIMYGESSLILSPYFAYKRLLDILLASIMLLVSLPIMLVVAAIVRVSLGAPVLFCQRRPGLRNCEFSVFKFRTMRAPYDSSGRPLSDEQRQTAATRMIRALRLDELPQLFNILRGEMSLVGPRPLLPRDQPKFADLRGQIRPGVTGWAQVNGGVQLTADEKLALDLWYAQKASLWLDIKILMMTMEMVTRGEKKNISAIGEALSRYRPILS